MSDEPKPSAERSYIMGNVGAGARAAQGENISWVEGIAGLPGPVTSWAPKRPTSSCCANPRLSDINDLQCKQELACCIMLLPSRVSLHRILRHVCHSFCELAVFRLMR